MNIAVIDYGAGNIASVSNALKKLSVSFTITSDPDVVRASDKVIFPGQGRAGPAMKTLRSAKLADAIKGYKKPFLGICLGLQLLADYSEEDETKCLSVIPGKVVRFPNTVKIPLMGWNTVHFTAQSSLTKGIPDNSYFYFVHSYYLNPPAEYVLGRTEYGVMFASVLQKDNFFATQFHPEKSGAIGLQMLRNFCEL